MDPCLAARAADDTADKDFDDAAAFRRARCRARTSGYRRRRVADRFPNAIPKLGAEAERPTTARGRRRGVGKLAGLATLTTAAPLRMQTMRAHAHDRPLA